MSDRERTDTTLQRYIKEMQERIDRGFYIDSFLVRALLRGYEDAQQAIARLTDAITDGKQVFPALVKRAEAAESRIATLEAENRVLLSENERFSTALVGYASLKITTGKLALALDALHGYVQHKEGCAKFPWPSDDDWQRLCATPVERRRPVYVEILAKPRPDCTCDLDKHLAALPAPDGGTT